MRKITQKIVGAFRNGKSLRISNTSTDGITVFLHGNAIFRYNALTNDYSFTLAGWNTQTTRERVNGLLQSLVGPEYRISSSKGILYYWNNGQCGIIDSNLWYKSK